MTPDVVVDIGNTRVKWGVCKGNRVTEVRRLSLDEPAIWDAELATLPPRTEARRWALASVNPPALARFRDWLQPHGRIAVFENATALPIRVNVDEPAKVGIDRLFGAIAAKSLVPKGTPAITVDVGTAVTVNLIDANGVFQGGAIFPGPRLMGRALHEHTAKLPLIDLGEVPEVRPPGKNTADAIRAGIAAAVQGGVAVLLERLGAPWPRLFLTGGARGSLSKYQFRNVDEVVELPTLVLEGIRIAAEALP
ncbi:MAG: type III pantothenate kinase [Planctomycetes bacterium]|nr:type III pantothenate kinase [Planctomycetota bacterium]